MEGDLKQKIADAIAPTVENEGLDLVEVKLAQYGRNSRVQLFIDSLSDKGVSLGDCTRISRLIAGIIDSEGFFRGEYTLEVSSPGLDRPLVSERDFKRKIGRTIQVDFLDSSRGSLRGVLKEVEAGELALEQKRGEQKVQMSEIKVAREYI